MGPEAQARMVPRAGMAAGEVDRDAEFLEGLADEVAEVDLLMALRAGQEDHVPRVSRTRSWKSGRPPSRCQSCRKLRSRTSRVGRPPEHGCRTAFRSTSPTQARILYRTGPGAAARTGGSPPSMGTH
jgi:hypothetical protein